MIATLTGAPSRALVLLFLATVTTPSQCGQAFVPGTTTEFLVPVPQETRDLSRSARPMPSVTAAAAVAVPVDFDPALEWPVLLVSGGTDGGPAPSRRQLERYKKAALLAGWIIIAVDPVPTVDTWDDTVSLRFVLDLVVMAALHDAWHNAGRAAIAFAGEEGGARLAGWLGAMFVSQHSRVIGVFQESLAEESLINAAMQFQVLTNEDYLTIPVALYGGRATRRVPDQRLRKMEGSLVSAGFKNVVVASDSPDDDDGEALRSALRRFGEEAGRR